MKDSRTQTEKHHLGTVSCSTLVTTVGALFTKLLTLVIIDAGFLFFNMFLFFFIEHMPQYYAIHKPCINKNKINGLGSLVNAHIGKVSIAAGCTYAELETLVLEACKAIKKKKRKQPHLYQQQNTMKFRQLHNKLIEDKKKKKNGANFFEVRGFLMGYTSPVEVLLKSKAR